MTGIDAICVIIHIITCLASNDSSAENDLVLGAGHWYSNETNADLDNKDTPQTIQYWDPSTGIVTVIVHTDNAGHLSQTKITRDSLYYRYKWSGAWAGWYEVTPPNFYKSYNDISALASALGAAYMGNNNPYADTITDMDSVPTGHYSFWWADNSTPANFPNITTSAGKVRAFVEIYNVDNGYIYERVVNVYPYPNVDNRLEIFERFKGGATISWTPWWRNDNYGTSSLAGLASALGGAYYSFTGASSETVQSNTSYNIFDVAADTTVIFVFQYAGRKGVYAVNNTKITEIAPCVYLAVNDPNQTHAIWIDNGKAYFRSNSTQLIYWRVVQVL